MSTAQGLDAEAAAFNKRIEERLEAGFVPDIRRAVKCEYFYTSFWRDPHYIKLYLGQVVDSLLDMLRRHGGTNLRVLDVGCGAGYVSLEFARAGYNVTGIDIAHEAIAVARKTLESNPYRDGFGSLEYHVMPFQETSGSYDVVLFTGTIHHFDDPEEVIRKAAEILVSNGLVVAYEPCHEQWRLQDAAQVALIRGLLSLTGFWYQSSGVADSLLSREKLESYIEDIHLEYLHERDKHEQGQSPKDNSSSGQEILGALRKHLVELEYQPGFSFIYRLLGGLRGPDEVILKIADFLTVYDQLLVSKAFLRPNGFYFIGRKRP